MNNDHDIGFAWAKVAVAWVGLFIGGVTLSQVALVLTIVFTALQIYKLIRDLRRQNRADRVAEQAAASAAATVQALKDST